MMRFLKQLGYGVFYPAVIGLVVFLVYLVFFKAAPPEVVDTPRAPEIPEPTFSFESEVTHVEGEKIWVTGTLVNESPQVVGAVEITAKIFDVNGFELFSSETLQEDIRAFERRPFTVFFPETRDLARQIGKEFTELSYTIAGE